MTTPKPFHCRYCRIDLTNRGFACDSDTPGVYCVTPISDACAKARGTYHTKQPRPIDHDAIPA
jgi:hypothetical protein